MALIDKLNAIGNAIRKKNGTTDLISLSDMPQAILDIVSGGGESYENPFCADSSVSQVILPVIVPTVTAEINSNIVADSSACLEV